MTSNLIPEHVVNELNLCSVESEKDVLTNLLDRDDSSTVVREIDLQPGEFFDSKHQFIWRSILNAIELDKLINVVTVTEQMQLDGTFKKLPTLYLDELSHRLPTTYNIWRCVEIIKEKSHFRTSLEWSRQYARASGDQDQDTLDRLLANVPQNGRLRQPEPEPDPFQPLPDTIPAIERPHLDHWIGLYVDYALKVSPMTPADFHESAGLWLASVAIARRLKVPMPFGDIYPNLFITWIASTTLYRKTTALDIARRIAHRIMAHLLAAQDSTPEVMLNDLAGAEPTHLAKLNDRDKELWEQSRNFAAQKGWTLDEISSLLASAGRDYNAGMLETILRLYDCDNRYTRSTRSQGLTIVKNAYLSILGASTPGAMATHLTNKRLWSMGFWPRFAILTPEHKPEWREPQDNIIEPSQIGTGLGRLLDRLPTQKYPEPPAALTVTFASGVYQTWQHFNKAMSYDLIKADLDEKLHGTYGRLPVMALKVGTILAALDWQDRTAPEIESYHLAHAVAICEKWRASAHRALDMAGTNELSDLEESVIKQLGRFEPKGATCRDIYKALSRKRPEVEEILSQLVDFAFRQSELTWQRPGNEFEP